ncbi:MAG TPA: T9SS type A sorting domain-containing protein, partial [Bacteroidia bacterium]|nr:T9SS type A sorting domain-containing protein [Bacteroidia bacterium]
VLRTDTMKHIHFLRIAVLPFAIAIPALVYGQDFLNGSFEQNGNLCLINVSTSVFNANVKNTHAYGNYRRPDIASSDCGKGDAKDGNWFVGLATNISGNNPSEAITLELSAPLNKGAQYSMTFWARQRSAAPNIELGQSVADTLNGQIFYTVSSANIGNDWTEINVRFTAPNNGKYISVRASNPNQISGVWLDGFQMHEIFQPENVVMISKTEPVVTRNNNPEAVVKKEVRNEVGLFPNPSEGIFKVNSDTSELVSLVVYNMLGSAVEQHVATQDQPVPDHIDLTDQQPGMYFVEMAMVGGEKVTKRIIVSR